MIIGINDSLGVYYVSNDSTFKGNYEKYVAGDDAIIEKHLELFKQYPIAYSNHMLHMATYMFKQKQIKRAISYKVRAWRACWNNPQNITVVYLINKIIQGNR